MKFQAPKGTRDFYPEEMAWRNYLHDAWRRVSIRNGFDAVDGPIFESLDLYKVKSGEGIVSELFHFTDRGERELAIRPEFTPTLARMVASQANRLPRPIKWFSIPNLCRAEKPQRGRLREFFQWNIDILGAEGSLADAECIFVAVDLLRELGLNSDQVRVKISHRRTVKHILAKMGVSDDMMLKAFDLLDRRDRLDEEAFLAGAKDVGLDEQQVDRFDQICRMKYRGGKLDQLEEQLGINEDLADLKMLDQQLAAFGITDWCEYDLGIVRGLAYYTGTVFEIHEISGVERAMAGGGRYDKLIESFGGPSMPGMGFGMGDVVLTNVLQDKGLLPDEFAPQPNVFVISLSDDTAANATSLVADLREQGLHARFSYKATRNVGKLLKEASSAKARYAVILDDNADSNTASLKDLQSGEQVECAIEDLVGRISS
jgi:histidyl-tRNA synthetase